MPIPKHPFATLYGKPAIELVLTELDTIKPKEIDTVISWVKATTEELQVQDLREPTVSMPLFEESTLSLLRLAQKAAPELPSYQPDFEDSEIEDTAALLLAATLIRRESANTTTSVSSTPEGDEVATRRKWKTLEDAITALKTYEDEIVELGSAVLRKKRDLKAQWEHDEDDGTFIDAAGDVRRRLDFVDKHKELFKGSKINNDFLKQGEDLYKDAMAFFRGREGRQTPKTEMTLARDQAFTLLIKSIEELRPLLILAYKGDTDAQSKLAGKFWKRLERLSKPRKPRKSDESASGTPK
jgi:hypothetical protein